MSVCIPRVALQGSLRSLTLETLGPVGPVILTVPTINGGLVGGLPAGTPGQVLSVDGSGNLIWTTPAASGTHVLATTSGLGASHTVSGLTAGMMLRATGATTAAFQLIQAADLPNHNLITAHTATGLTVGHVLTALSSNTFGFAPVSPFVNPMTVTANGLLAEYTTIQAAINAATSGMTVSIPPGTYTENITLKNGVLVAELISGTVIINGNVTTAIGGFLQVDTIQAFGTGVAAINATHSSGVSCVILARNIAASGVSGTSYGVNKSGAGDLILYARSITSTNVSLAYGVNVTAGTFSLFGAYVVASDLDLRQTGGTLTIGGGVNYSTSSGSITILPGSGGVTPTGGAWTSFVAGAINLKPDLPALVSGGVMTEYASIQAAIDAASSGDRVVIPPGLYNEQITLKNGVRVAEAFPGTVVLTNNGIANGTAVIAADGGYLQVDAIAATGSGGTFTGIDGAMAATCTIILHRIIVTGAAIGGFVVSSSGGGTLNLWVDELTSDGSATFVNGIIWDSGTLNLFLRGAMTAIGSGSGIGITFIAPLGSPQVNIYGGTLYASTYLVDLSNAIPGSVSFNGCYFDASSVNPCPVPTVGRITYGAGDRASLTEAAKMPLMHQ